MLLEKMPAVQRLTDAEKVQLVTELCDYLVAEDGRASVSRAQMVELDRRWAAFQADPASALTKKQFRAKVAAMKR